jgi:hypothetical protein
MASRGSVNIQEILELKHRLGCMEPIDFIDYAVKHAIESNRNETFVRWATSWLSGTRGHPYAAEAATRFCYARENSSLEMYRKFPSKLRYYNNLLRWTIACNAATACYHFQLGNIENAQAFAFSCINDIIRIPEV